MSDTLKAVFSVFIALCNVNFIEILKGADNIEVFNQDGNFVVALNAGKPDLVNRSIEQLASMVKNMGGNPGEIHYDEENRILTLYITPEQRAELERLFPSKGVGVNE